MEKLLQLNEFFVEGGRPEMSHVLLTLIQPTSETEEKEKGYFFAICEINHSTSEQLTELQRIMEEIENGYYETADTSERNSLEIVLEKINQQNLSLFSLNLSLSCIVGAVKSNSVVFSYCGEPNILLFYKSKEGVYKKMDLVEKQDEEEKEKILFSQIVQGKINFGDYFFLGIFGMNALGSGIAKPDGISRELASIHVWLRPSSPPEPLSDPRTTNWLPERLMVHAYSLPSFGSMIEPFHSLPLSWSS